MLPAGHMLLGILVRGLGKSRPICYLPRNALLSDLYDRFASIHIVFGISTHDMRMEYAAFKTLQCVDSSEINAYSDLTHNFDDALSDSIPSRSATQNAI